MKAVDRVGNQISIGSIVVSGNLNNPDPVKAYGVVAKNKGNNCLTILKPTTEKNGELTTTIKYFKGEVVRDNKDLAVKFNSLLFVNNVPEHIANRLYQAVLHRASKPRGHK